MKAEKIAEGVTFPFYPMRPRLGESITQANVRLALRRAKADGYLVQPKLNGDRVLVAVLEDHRVLAVTRHNSPYSFKVMNLELFAGLPAMTVLDGEVYRRQFYPFEAVAVAGESLVDSGPEERAPRARELCHRLGVAWQFDAPTARFMENRRGNLPVWEGVVLKKLGSRYLPLGSEAQESATWVKRRW